MKHGEREVKALVSYEQYLAIYDQAKKLSKKNKTKVSLGAVVRVAINRYLKEIQNEKD